MGTPQNPEDCKQLRLKEIEKEERKKGDKKKTYTTHYSTSKRRDSVRGRRTDDGYDNDSERDKDTDLALNNNDGDADSHEESAHNDGYASDGEFYFHL
jgi:hypothetical protein